MRHALILLLLFGLLSQITACGTLAASGAARDSGDYGFNDNGASHSDASISAAIRSRLINDPTINASHIRVSTERGVVTLQGQVANDAVRKRIIRLCDSTPGVKQVNARLTLGQD
ncbi:BON domain-containing protein [Thiohalophilus sp.]|uniref:BON domain-containing protein n=1 Tax=Thiohalophilus sp. TaxID=3028392 RepID=UPI002ACD2B55|nr:BON domain-containing protein [Thiohalophilus sp.]MDZ7804214.1 BON domain-containing protein [Thiohalophilus sp.]